MAGNHPLGNPRFFGKITIEILHFFENIAKNDTKNKAEIFEGFADALYVFKFKNYSQHDINSTC